MSENEWKKEFPDNLEYLLKLKEMTQRELAEKIGCTEASMSRYANGSRVPKITTVINMSRALNVSIEEFF